MSNDDCKVNVRVIVDIVTGRKTSRSEFGLEDVNISPVKVLFKASEWMGSLEHGTVGSPELTEINFNGSEMPPELRELFNKIMRG